MDKRVVSTRPILDTIAAVLVVFPILRFIMNTVSAKWGVTLQIASLGPLCFTIFSCFSPPRVGMADSKTSKKTQRAGNNPPIWSAVIEIYLLLLGKSIRRRSVSITSGSHRPIIRYVGSTCVGLLLSKPSSWQFLVNGLYWTQFTALDEEGLLVLYNLTKHSLYRITAVNKVSGDQEKIIVCTSYDESDSNMPQALKTTAQNAEDQNIVKISSVSTSSHLPHDSISIQGSQRPSIVTPSVSSAVASHHPSHQPASFTSSISITSNPEGHHMNGDVSSDLMSNPSWSSSPSHQEGTLLTDLQCPKASSTSSNDSSAYQSFGEDVLPRPRRRFDTYQEAASGAQRLLDSVKAQNRKARKDWAKKMGNLRSEIESQNTKIASKRRSDERTRKRIQALKDRVVQHRIELEQLTKMETIRQSPEIESLANRAELIQREFQSRKQGYDVSVRIWAELQRSKRTEISKLEQRCAKLSDRVEKARREYHERCTLASERIDGYIDHIKEERSNRKVRRVRLESDFIDAIRRLDKD